ncbi:hypothetical protein DCCM_2897 [Desulfocucumis palustris]|uniref:Uncharacterized protein n=1 Tax=Desulfocucumis palustris TaxID=1898651 RepID=A0A2L2XHS7_9FIRM|nr:hypothetical protein DCCM_2897 [Desulfocucumis palustris]
MLNEISLSRPKRVNYGLSDIAFNADITQGKTQNPPVATP